MLNRTLRLAKDGQLREGKRRADGFIEAADGRPPFVRLIPLQEIIAAVLGQGVNTKGVQDKYRRLVGELGSELAVLLDAGGADLEAAAEPELAAAVLRGAGRGHLCGTGV